MGLLSDRLPQVKESIEANVAAMTTQPPREFPVVVSQEVPNERPSPVVQPVQPTQTVQTKDRQATGEILNDTEGPMEFEVVPLISNEVYSVDIIDEKGNPVFTVNTHSGRLGSKINLPKGRYRYFLKTVQNDMPFSVVHRKGA